MRCKLEVLFLLSIGIGILHIVAQANAAAANVPRSKIDVSVYPWSAIGKLYNSNGGSCTGTLIEPDIVLTAAHCLFNHRTNQFIAASSLHFLLGYARGEYKVHRVVSGYILAPNYNPNQKDSTVSSLSFDWAFLKLPERVPLEIRPISLIEDTPKGGMKLMAGGYFWPRLYVMSVEDCELIGSVANSALIEHNCRLGPGSSGAPLISWDGDKVVIVGMQVATGRKEGSEIMLALPANAIAKNLRSH